MKNCKLTNEMQEFLMKLIFVLGLPTKNNDYHEWFGQSIEKFRKMDFAIAALRKEVRDMLDFLEKHSHYEITENGEASRAFHNLRIELQKLHLTKKIYEKCILRENKSQCKPSGSKESRAKL